VSAPSIGVKTEEHAFIRITQVRSAIGTKPKHRATLRALGLRGIGRSKVFKSSQSVRGMLSRVTHLVEVTAASAEELVRPARRSDAHLRATSETDSRGGTRRAPAPSSPAVSTAASPARKAQGTASKKPGATKAPAKKAAATEVPTETAPVEKAPAKKAPAKKAAEKAPAEKVIAERAEDEETEGRVEEGAQ